MQTLNPIEIKVLHACVAFDPHFIHEFLDIDLIVCIDAIRTLKGVSDNLRDQIKLFPDRSEKLCAELRKFEILTVKSLVDHSQTHGISEKDSKKLLANPAYPYSTDFIREPVTNIGSHQ